MKTVSREEIAGALKAISVQAGDGLLIHSAIQFFGQPVGGVGVYLEAIKAAIGPSGTLVVPTFNFAFARGEPYNPQSTPSDGMGVFSEYVRQQPEAIRTPNPMHSLAVIGHHAEDLASRDTPSAFDSGSPYDRMLALDFKLLLLGASIQAASMVHYCEQRAGVPYRYWKAFSGPVWVDDRWETSTYRMFVRDMSLNPQLNLTGIQKILQARGLWNAARLNYGWVAACRLVDFVAVVNEMLAADPWALVTTETAG